MKWKIGIVSVSITAIVVYNLPYFREIRFFNKVEEAHNLVMCDRYISKYPDGKHLDDVMYIRIQILEHNMPSVTEYLEKFPSGKHVTEVNALCDILWDKEIERYNKRDKGNESKAAVKYMSEMLQYMKKHRINSILVDVNSTLKLKDYNEYDTDVRKLLEILNKDKISIADGMISLKSNFTSTDNTTLMDILISGVQKSVNKIFSPNFITVVSFSDNKDRMPHLMFNYTITSQEISNGKVIIPHIWKYTNESGVTLNYLMGISVEFQAHFSIPESSTVFDYIEKSEPSDNINDVKNIRDGYRQMTQICFALFSNKMSKNLGLEETYFQGNDED